MKYKKLLLIASAMLICSGIAGVSPIIEANAEVTNNLTIIDAKQENLSYMRTNVYPNAFGSARSVIGFDIPASEEVETINRLTIQVKYYTYPWWDVFHISPISNQKSSIISSANLYDLSATYTLGAIYNIPNIPAIGIPSDIPYEAITSFTGISSTPYQTFLAKNWYVILPYDYTYEEIFISIDAYTVSGGHISDGTNDGDPWEDGDGNYFFEFNLTSPYIYFTSDTEIISIEAKQFSNAPSISGAVKLQFGNYDFEKQKIDPIISTCLLTENGVIPWDIDVPAASEGYLSSVLGGAAIIRITYQATSPIVSYNLRDVDGNLPEPVNDPTPTSIFDEWWAKIQEQINEIILFFSIIGGTILIALLLNFLVFPLIQLFRRQ